MPYGAAGAFQTLGRGIKDIGKVAGDSKREREELARIKEQEDYARRQDRMGQAMALSDRGGGFGDTPTLYDIPGRREPLPPSGSGLGSDELPTPLARSPLAVDTGKPNTARYQSGGEGEDKYYWERPDYRTNRLADEERDRVEKDRQADVTRMMGFGLDARAAGMQSMNMDPSANYGEYEDPVAQDVRRQDEGVLWRPPTTTAADGPDRASPQQVFASITGGRDGIAGETPDGRRWSEMSNAFLWEYSHRTSAGLSTDDMFNVVEPEPVVEEEKGPGLGEWIGNKWKAVTGFVGRSFAPGDVDISGGANAGGRRGRTARDRADTPTPVATPLVGPNAKVLETLEGEPDAPGPTPVRINIGDGADGPGPGGTQPSRAIADQELLDQAVEEYRDVNLNELMRFMLDDKWSQADYLYVKRVLEDDRKEREQPQLGGYNALQGGASIDSIMQANRPASIRPRPGN